MEPLILCLNTGSSSLKFALYEKKHLTLLYSGAIEEIGQKQGLFWVKDDAEKKQVEERGSFTTHLEAIQRLFHFLDFTNFPLAPISHQHSSRFGQTVFPDVEETEEGRVKLTLPRMALKAGGNTDGQSGRMTGEKWGLAAVGHRVVHGGSYYLKPTEIDADVLLRLEELIPLAPLHLPQEIEVIKEAMHLFPEVKHIACFDTNFFHTLPETARCFSLPKKYDKIVRYGFHGLSYEYITTTTGPLPARVIIAHLGNGASIAAIKENKPINTTMGFSPAGGLIMSTRLGDIDPGVLIYLMREEQLNADDLEELVYKKSGLLALSGLSGDMHTLLQAKATFAIELFCTRIVQTIGSYFIELGGLDQLIFTAGIGERAALVRKIICEKLRPLGAALNEQKNSEHAPEISSPNSAFSIKVIPTNENYMIASHVDQEMLPCQRA